MSYYMYICINIIDIIVIIVQRICIRYYIYIYITFIINHTIVFRKSSSSYAWHGLNQSYDSFVNFSNRNGDTKYGIPTTQARFGISFVAATVTSTFAAFHIEKFLLSKICHLHIHPILYVRKSIL